MAAAFPSSTLHDQTGRHFILGTAGHIDHGKTSLVKALTGTNTDRLPEEQARGMTIELGFAELTVGNVHFGVVDVPGHERFVKTMVSGATGIDLVMLVIAADDSVMPQTIEHVDILRLLGIRRGIVAITKVDAVDEEMVELVREDIHRVLSDTPLAHAEMFPVSSLTGQGIDELKAGLIRAALNRHDDSANEAVTPRIDTRTNPFRMAVDRVFTVAGRGTVVTGSVLRGSVSAGDTLEVFPGNESCRVRDLQTHGESQMELGRGQRAAINVSGIDREKIERGSELATPGYLEPSRMMDVKIECLRSLDRPLKSSSIVRLGMGTREVPVRIVLLDREKLDPGESCYGQLRSGQPFTAVYGQRFIVRDETASRTLGGGIVLFPVSRRRKKATDVEVLRVMEQGGPLDRLEQVLRHAGFVKPSDLHLVSRAGVELEELPALSKELEAKGRWVRVPGSDSYATPSAIDDLQKELTGWLRRHHERQADSPGRLSDSVVGWLERRVPRSLAKPLLEEFAKRGAVKRMGRFVALPEFAPSLSRADEKALGILIENIRQGDFQPPSLEAVSAVAQIDRKRIERLATLAVAMSELVQIGDDIYLHVDSERKLRVLVDELIRSQGAVTVSQVREATNSSRKYVVPFLEYLDRVGFTKRIEDRRVLCESQ